MRIVVGLGNPGPEYSSTRHNIGFLAVEELGRRLGPGAKERRRSAWIERLSSDTGPILLARPRTYMNRSGSAVRQLLDVEEASAADLLVICDDLSLPFGSLRLRPRGSHGGHNGLRSIIERLGTGEFARLRVGIGAAEGGKDQTDFVLESFSRDEAERLPEIVDRAAACVAMALAEGIEMAMNRYNRRPAGESGGSEESP